MVNAFRICDDSGEAESAAYFVCILATEPTPFTDNVFDFCCECGVKIQHRPHGPVAPKKICLPCATPGMEREARKGELEVVATSHTVRELAEFIRKRSMS